MKRRKTEDVEIPITPMLDMAFQLLTFFILTYHPAPTEGQFSMNLLPAQPAVSMDAPATDAQANNNDLPAGLKTLPTSLYAKGDGTLGRIVLGENEIDGLPKFNQELAAIFKDPTLPFDQTVIKVDPRLKYSEVVKVIDAFSAFTHKISFTELTPGEELTP